ncbi:unnamed protein product [Clonostachys solani]|uniref:Cytochrome b561 domain-containing protein n=1 Tax=Clonostachys solani TaxID=160281 RepID=A0A9N9W748_9HYPO|nr:unnamed protein product [Clonostachys solani]
MRALRILATIAGLAIDLTSAQASFRAGQSRDIRFNWGVPEEAATSGSGNVYLQLDAPDTYSWVALGIGENMMTAKIFLVYQDGEGNVTLSTRQGQNHIMPTYVDRPKVELISGSRAADGRMVAKVRCGDCEDLDLSGQNSWVAAWSAGDAVNDKNTGAMIKHHDDKRIFTVDLSKASIGSDTDSFSEADQANLASDSDYGIVDTDEFSPIRLAHGIIMTTVFVGIYPLGALLMPVFNKWFLHSASQLVAYILMWVGVALGVTYSRQTSLFGKQTHTRLGLIVVILLSFQPVLGYLHHRYFAKHQSIGLVGHIHIWYGRALMVLGVVNGGLGLQLAGQTGGSWVISYSVIASTCFVAYLVSIIMSLNKQKRRRTEHSRHSGQRWPSPDSLLQTAEETYHPSYYQSPGNIPMKDLTRNRENAAVGDGK